MERVAITSPILNAMNAIKSATRNDIPIIFNNYELKRWLFRAGPCRQELLRKVSTYVTSSRLFFLLPSFLLPLSFLSSTKVRKFCPFRAEHKFQLDYLRRLRRFVTFLFSLFFFFPPIYRNSLLFLLADVNAALTYAKYVIWIRGKRRVIGKRLTSTTML